MDHDERGEVTTTSKSKGIALEFVKVVSHVLLLDTPLRPFVASMRRLLLAQVCLNLFSTDIFFIFRLFFYLFLFLFLFYTVASTGI
jgi:hypothetical protein